jgi:hypothetical protein
MLKVCTSLGNTALWYVWFVVLCRCSRARGWSQGVGAATWTSTLYSHAIAIIDISRDNCNKILSTTFFEGQLWSSVMSYKLSDVNWSNLWECDGRGMQHVSWMWTSKCLTANWCKRLWKFGVHGWEVPWRSERVFVSKGSLWVPIKYCTGRWWRQEGNAVFGTKK